MSLYEYLQRDPGLTTDQYLADLACRGRLNSLPDGLSADPAVIRRELEALTRQGLIACEGGCWEVCEQRMPVGPRQGALWT